MIYPPDELLADLQSVIPEASQDGRASAGSGKGQYDYLPELPGADEPRRRGEDREVFEVPPGYDPPALTPPPGGEVSVYYMYIIAYPFVLLPPSPPSLSLSQEEDAYTTVRHGPRYVPKQDQGGGRGGESPPPAKPRRTDRPADYDTTAMFRKQESSERVDGGGGGGLEELDNLLEMLSTTQQQQTGKEGGRESWVEVGMEIMAVIP